MTRTALSITDEAVKEMIAKLQAASGWHDYDDHRIAKAATMLLALTQQAAVSRRLAIEEAAKVCEGYKAARDASANSHDTMSAGWLECINHGNAAVELMTDIRALSPTLDIEAMVERNSELLFYTDWPDADGEKPRGSKWKNHRYGRVGGPDDAGRRYLGLARAVLTALIGEP